MQVNLDFLYILLEQIYQNLAQILNWLSKNDFLNFFMNLMRYLKKIEFHKRE